MVRNKLDRKRFNLILGEQRLKLCVRGETVELSCQLDYLEPRVGIEIPVSTCGSKVLSLGVPTGEPIGVWG